MKPYHDLPTKQEILSLPKLFIQIRRSCFFFDTVSLKIPHAKYSVYVLQNNTDQTLQLYKHRPTDRISLTKAKLLCVLAFLLAPKNITRKGWSVHQTLHDMR